MRTSLLVVAFALAGCSSGGDPTDAGGSDTRGLDAGPGTDAPPSDVSGVDVSGDGGACLRARRLFFEDFESGGYSRWTSMTYNADWGDTCQSNGLSTREAVSGSTSQRSEIVCAGTESHRGYGGLQFDGDSVVPAYTNTGVGIDAPFGVVNTYWSRLETPYDFEGGRWFSFFTVQSDCSWASEPVLTLGLENTTWRLTPAHVISTGGTVTFEADAPAFPRDQWVRTTIYVNYVEGELHVWQDGASVLHATFSRPTTDLCQWHWGAYASGDNDDVVLYEDDISIWKLEEAWTDWEREPWLDQGVRPCP